MTFSKQASPEDVADLVLLLLFALRHHLLALGRRARTSHSRGADDTRIND